MKLHELAKELDKPAKELIAVAAGLGIEAKNTFVQLTEEQAEKIKGALSHPLELGKDASLHDDSDSKTPRRRRVISLASDGAVKRVRRAAPEEVKIEPVKVEEEALEEGEESEVDVQESEEVESVVEAETEPELAEKPAEPTIPGRVKIGLVRRGEPVASDQLLIDEIPVKAPAPTVPETPERLEKRLADEALKAKKPVKKDRFGEVKGGAHKNLKNIDLEAREARPTSKKRFTKFSSPTKGSQKRAAEPKSKHVFQPRKKDLVIAGSMTVGDLAGLIGVRAPEIMKTLMKLGIMATITQVIDPETSALVAAEFEVDVKVEVKSLEDGIEQIADDVTDLVPRPPVVTIMGHVDHGKTSLLDKIRSTNVATGEAGGITQHIGAYHVKTDAGQITFLDTPGHEAFTAMRARGANATDIVILVVAADDGPRPQTVEAIHHAKAAKVPIIVAINKIDKPGANAEKVMQELMSQEIVAEEYGGETVMVKVSAHSGEGIDRLLEAIALQAEIMELKANPKRLATGVVIESRMEKGRGNVATVLIQNGTLNLGDPYVVGCEFGRVRAMWNDLNKKLKTVEPSIPVEIVGLNGLPKAGDQFTVGTDEKQVRQIAEARAARSKEAQQTKDHAIRLENLFENAASEKTELNLIIKTDVVGSQEALSDALQKLGNEEVSVRVIHSAVGAITRTDVVLAAASKAIIIAFNTRPDASAKSTASEEGVEIRLYSVIYDAIEDVTKALEGMLRPVIREELQGRAEILQLISIPKVGVIAGSKVIEGKIIQNCPVRVIRDNVMIHDGKLSSLKRFKENAKEVAVGYECGIGIVSYKDLKEGDIIECYKRLESSATL